MFTAATIQTLWPHSVGELMPQSRSDSEIVDGYLQHFMRRDDSWFWAWEAVNDYLSSDPDHAWRLTLQLIASAPTEEALAYVAAGPLEDILYARGERYIAEVERRAVQDPKFRRALRSVCNESTSPGDVHDRVRMAASQADPDEPQQDAHVDIPA